jgi:hypothetical protein
VCTLKTEEKESLSVFFFTTVFFCSLLTFDFLDVFGILFNMCVCVYCQRAVVHV